jgi:hypothetical protein
MHSLRRWIIIVACVIVVLITWCVWKLRTRTNFVITVDAAANTILPPEFVMDSAVGNLDNPFWDFGVGLSSPLDAGDNHVFIRATWTMPLAIFVTSKGYDRVHVLIDDRTPPIIFVTLHKLHDPRSTSGIRASTQRAD